MARRSFRVVRPLLHRLWLVRCWEIPVFEPSRARESRPTWLQAESANIDTETECDGSCWCGLSGRSKVYHAMAFEDRYGGCRE